MTVERTRGDYAARINFARKKQYDDDVATVALPYASAGSLAKLVIDFTFCVLAFPAFVVLCVALIILNPFVNPGPLFFRQERMGQGGRPFIMWKFRTMTVSNDAARPHDAPLEHDRITVLGHLLRKTRMDELPNMINIMKGDMSLVGPRPDAIEHARAYWSEIPYYKKRFAAKPGITGLAQVRSGYADTKRAVMLKAKHDSFYIDRASLLLDLHIIWCTIGVVIRGTGAR